MFLSVILVAKMVLLEISGWVEDGEEFTNVPKKCPKCGGKLHKTDALKLCNILFVYCDANHLSISHWCEIFSLPL